MKGRFINSIPSLAHFSPEFLPGEHTVGRRLTIALLFWVVMLTACQPATETAVTQGAQAGAPGIGDSLYPGFGNGGYDVQRYDLSLRISDVVTCELHGVASIEAQARQDLSSFNLDFIGFTIDGITVNGRDAEYSRSGQELTVRPAAPLHAGETFTVLVTYRGAPAQVISVAMPVLTGWVIFDGGSYVLSEPDGAANFFPVNDHPLDKAVYTFRITVPKPFQVAANGVLTETIDNGGTTTFVWEERTLMASYLATVNIGQFDVETGQSPDGVPIRNYYAAGVPASMRSVFARQAEMLAVYGERFGRYPFDVYGAVVVNTVIGSAMETQTLSLFGVEPGFLADSQLLEVVVAHELAHQWFGDSVSPADWSHIWLNESFATYAEGLWIEHRDGRAALDAWVRDTYGQVVASRDRLIPPGKPRADDLFNSGVYLWGALGLHALRLELGDALFFDLLKTYCGRFRSGNATTADFIAVAEEVGGRRLDAFFQSWLYSQEIAPIPALGLAADQQALPAAERVAAGVSLVQPVPAGVYSFPGKGQLRRY